MGGATNKNRTLDAKLLISFERVFTAQRHMLWVGAADERISPIQMQILMALNREPGLCGVSVLANYFALTKPTVSEAVKSLVTKGYLQRLTGARDRRIVGLRLTNKGKGAAIRAASGLQAMSVGVTRISKERKAQVLAFMMDWLTSLFDAGILPKQAMCLTCENLVKERSPGSLKPHYCKLLKRSVGDADFVFDCRHHYPLKRGSPNA